MMSQRLKASLKALSCVFEALEFVGYVIMVILSIFGL